MFGSLLGLVSDALKVADTIVSVPVAAVRVVTKPAADLLQEVKQEVEQAVKDITE